MILCKFFFLNMIALCCFGTNNPVIIAAPVMRKIITDFSFFHIWWKLDFTLDVRSIVLFLNIMVIAWVVTYYWHNVIKDNPSTVLFVSCSPLLNESCGSLLSGVYSLFCFKYILLFIYTYILRSGFVHIKIQVQKSQTMKLIVLTHIPSGSSLPLLYAYICVCFTCF